MHIKPGKTLKLTLAFPAGDAPASFYVIGQLDPANLFNDVNLADNVFATSALVTVA